MPGVRAKAFWQLQSRCRLPPHDLPWRPAARNRSSVSAHCIAQVANGGGGQGLLVDTLGRLINPSYKQRVALHEAGHMLVAYVVGILPRAYTLSSYDAFLRWGGVWCCVFCNRKKEGILPTHPVLVWCIHRWGGV